MNARTCRIATAGILIVGLLPFTAAHAQLGDLMKQGESSGLSGGLGNLGGVGDALSGQSITSGSTSNVAGLLEFCIKNNYLGGKMCIRDRLKVKATVSAQGEDTVTYDQAAAIFDKMSLTPEYPEFLTLPLYEAMD